MSEHAKHVSLRSRVNPGTFVQYPIDRRSAQTRRRDNFIYTYRSPNLHITIRTLFRRSHLSSCRVPWMAMSIDSILATI
jgi:hypothetical protein